MEYTLLAGARANVGDHLIVSRAKRLLESNIPDVRFLELPRWESIEPALERVNSTRGIILCGGPAYQPKLYPGIYPLVKDLRQIRVPIIPLGLGWKGVPGDEQSLHEYRFTPSSMQLLARMHDDCEFTSCRDYLTKEALRKHGFENVIMTGDPAWYDMDFVQKDYRPPREIRTIAVSAPARELFHDQCVNLVDQCKRKFPEARVICTFHHGWQQTQNVNASVANTHKTLRDRLEERDCETVSLAADLERMQGIYDRTDLHIGYRLHAHLYFISRQQPSFLLEEDGRGRGASEALGLKSLPAWKRPARSSLVRRLAIGRLGRRIATRALGASWSARDEVVGEAMDLALNEISTEYHSFRAVHATIKETYHSRMQRFIELLS